MRYVPLVVLALAVAPTLARAEALAPVTSFGTNPGALDMYEHVPASLPAHVAPLVVVLHGCTQTAASMQNAGWDTLADTLGFAVLYPQQRSANNSESCFDWFGTTDQARGAGEAASIVEMVDQMIATNAIDTTRVYVTGLSAGAAYTAVMLATYPDRFAAGSIMSGLPFKCATDETSAYTCMDMSASSEKTPAAWSALVTAADTSFTGTWPRVQIWHGTADYTVFTQNATELVKQWTDLHHIDQTASSTETISTATRTQYSSGTTVVVEEYLVSGMGHAVAVGSDPMGTCPGSTGSYFSDEQICSTLRAADFFGLLGSTGTGTGSGSDPGTGSGSGSGSGGSGENGEDGTGMSGGGGCNVGGAGSAALPLLAAFGLRSARRRRPRADRRAR